MATAQPVVKFTWEDYRTAPPDKRYELLDGDLLMTPAPNLRHQRVHLSLSRRLAGFIEERALGELFVAPCDVVLSDTDVVQPDLLFVSRERAHLPERRRERAGSARPGDRDPVARHRRPRPGLQAGALRPGTA